MNLSAASSLCTCHLPHEDHARSVGRSSNCARASRWSVFDGSVWIRIADSRKIDSAFLRALEVGRAAIRDYWSKVTASQTSVELRYGRSIVDGRRLAVEWWANLQTIDGPLTLAGEFLLRFDGTGECRELREYWVLTQGRVEPPSGWGE